MIGLHRQRLQSHVLKDQHAHVVQRPGLWFRCLYHPLAQFRIQTNELSYQCCDLLLYKTLATSLRNSAAPVMNRIQ